MERRFVLFLVISFAILIGYYSIVGRQQRELRQQQAKQRQAARADGEGDPGKKETQDRAKEEPPKPEEEPEQKGHEIVPAGPGTPEYVTVGSVDPADPYRMLVTLSSKGASIERIELSSPRYRDLDDRGRYLGNLIVNEEESDPAARELGCVVQVVGRGTPAAKAEVIDGGTPDTKDGLRPGDVITAVDDRPVTGAGSLAEELKRTRANQPVKLTVLRPTKQSKEEPEKKPDENHTPKKGKTAKDDRQQTRKQAPEEAEAAAGEKPADEQKRGYTELTLSATLGHRPLELVRPERQYVQEPGEEHPSLLLTLHQLDNKKLGTPEEPVKVGGELAGLHLWDGDWEFQQGEDEEGNPEVVFSRVIEGFEQPPALKTPQAAALAVAAVSISEQPPLLRTPNAPVLAMASVPLLRQSPLLRITKTYRLKRVPGESIEETTFPAYHMEFEIEIRNIGKRTREVAYQLDGPSGLVTEGEWYNYNRKLSRAWGGPGMRDLVVSFDQQTPDMVNCHAIGKAKADDKNKPSWTGKSVTYMGVDTQYFSSVLIPQKKAPNDTWFAETRALRVGRVDEEALWLTNTSCRMISQTEPLQPGDALKHEFVIFAGPKKPDLLAKDDYKLDELVYYGWPIYAYLAVPLVSILHFFYGIVCSYGLAIIMLTVLVRCCMFPLSRKQVLNAQKMQELQPELKKLQEKHKKDMQARSKAQQELFRKHNCNPLSGCLVLFVQLPIFVALYRSLMVDIELRDAPLFWHALGWCSDLSAPDMLFNWSGFMPGFITSGRGILGLGPYLNLLPLLTVVLFIVQQKMFMPPPADDQAKMQQKIMKFMMVFIGLLFFKVASGLCVYFIASSLWGLAERRFMPKPAHKLPQAKPETRADAKARARAQTEAKAKIQTRTQAKSEARPKPQKAASSGDGSPTGKTKKRKRKGKKQKSRGKR